jgi:hypothetical protein
MKKFLIATNLLLLAIIIFQACHKKNVPPCNTDHSFCGDSTCFNNDGSPLKGLIDYNLALRMSADYANDDGKSFIYDGHTNTMQPDARSIWFDLNKLKKFIGFIESSLCKASCVKTDSFGVRLYFAKYPGEADMKKLSDLYGVPLEYAHHHTLFMVPTFWDPVRNRNIDFDPRQPVSGCQLKQIDSTSKGVYIQFTQTPGSTSQEQNHGSLMPPPAGAGGSFPTPAN